MDEMVRNLDGASPRRAAPDSALGSGPGLPRSGSRFALAAAAFLVGVVVAGTLGLDFFPSGGDVSTGLAEHRTRAELKLDLERLRQESSRVARDRQVAVEENTVLKRLLQGTAPGEEFPIDDVDRVLALLDDGEWLQLEDAIGKLLSGGERGFQTLMTAARVVIADRERLRVLEREEARLALLKPALRNEIFVVDLINHVLASDAFRQDRAFADRVLEWASRFVSVIYRGPETVKVRGSLVQILERRLEAGEGIWSTLTGLEALQSSLPVDSIVTLLRSSRHAAQRGVVLKYLGQRVEGRSREAVEILVGFVSAAFSSVSSAPPQWEVEMALDMLARSDSPPASEALGEFLRSPKPALAESAHLAYFSRERERDPDLPRLITFLNSSASLLGKRRVLFRVRRSSPELFAMLVSAPDAVDQRELRDDLRSATRARG